MKKFVWRVLLFLIPILFAFLYTELLFSTEKGDLLKVGYIADRYDYDKNKLFKEEFHRKKFFTSILELNLNKKNKYKILVIGDSFSGQGNFGYTNYLAELNPDSLLYFDRELHDNPIQTLFDIANGDILDSLDLQYIVLQTVEREIPNRYIVDKSKAITIDSLSITNDSRKSLVGKSSNQLDKLFSDRMLRFILMNLGYIFNDNAFFSDTYIVKTKDTLFSVNNNNLLFYFVDLKSLNSNSNHKILEEVNNQFNILSAKLTKRGIKLIVLISPDKYGVYYDEIIGKEKYPEPQFFDLFAKFPKHYLFVNSKELLEKAIHQKTDIYFYDDTHWSPLASKIIAKEINKQIEEDELTVTHDNVNF